MSQRAVFAILLLLNVLTLNANFSQQSRAATSRMSYEQLMSDPNFVHAVKSIAEACTVNVDIAKLKC
jgi:hypothetical protein